MKYLHEYLRTNLGLRYIDFNFWTMVKSDDSFDTYSLILSSKSLQNSSRTLKKDAGR